jgi:hypothetical protein
MIILEDSGIIAERPLPRGTARDFSVVCMPDAEGKLPTP